MYMSRVFMEHINFADTQALLVTAI